MNSYSEFISELKQRGMINDLTPGAEEQLAKGMTTAYVGIDPTADSLHIGHLVSLMMLKHFQMKGHKPIILIGGATGMIGDPSGKSEERNLLDEKTLRHNQECIKVQASKFLDFDSGKDNSAILVNNYDWMKEYTFLSFIREIGKHITVNYMIAKDSVKKRIGEDSDKGMSFTEFSYQLVQATDFLELYKSAGCKLQMGGSDQWGNITTGIELIRRKTGGEAYALTCPLITKNDGSKFGKTEEGNIWLDPEKTSAFKFYQFWLNASDNDAEKYIKIFTTLDIKKISGLIKEHRQSPHLRILQKKLAEEITMMVHSKNDLEKSITASEILFGSGTRENLEDLNEKELLNIFEGVPIFKIDISELDKGLNILDLLAVKTKIVSSKGEARRLLKSGGISLNKVKLISDDKIVTKKDLLNQRYLLPQIGKKRYFMIDCS